jgi:ankyrin repeat protein
MSGEEDKTDKKEKKTDKTIYLTNTDQIKIFVEKHLNGDINKYIDLPNTEDSILHLLSKVTRVDFIDFLISTYPDLDLNILNKNGDSPLITMVKDENITMIEYFLNKKDVDVNFQDKDGLTALHHACMKNDKIGLVKMIVKHSNVDVNKCDNEGNSPLHYITAVYTDRVETINHLIDNGADFNLLNNKNNSPIDFIRKYCKNNSLPNNIHPLLLKEIQKTKTSFIEILQKNRNKNVQQSPMNDPMNASNDEKTEKKEEPNIHLLLEDLETSLISTFNQFITSRKLINEKIQNIKKSIIN